MVGEIEPTFSARFDISKKLGATNSGESSLLKKVKSEGGEHCVRVVKTGFVPPLYVEIHELGDGGVILQTQFAEHYGLCYEGLNPKRVRVPKDITLEEVSRILDPL
jgi:hypothetical protein